MPSCEGRENLKRKRFNANAPLSTQSQASQRNNSSR